MSDLFPVYSLKEAQKTVLKRIPPDEFEVSENIANSIEAIFGERLTAEQAVRQIINDVRHNGDPALSEWTQRIDGPALKSLSISPDEIKAGYQATPQEIIDTLYLSEQRVRQFYRKQPATSWIDSSEEGLLGQLILPIDRVGVYVPGGTAPLPSSLIMSAVPAQVAGVREIICCTPPGKDGTIPDVILAAAYVCGIKKVYKLGGAMAIAAMAYGTQTIPAVDKIVGPGNLFVMLAKRQVYGAVGIDGLLGPTETMIIADKDANPVAVAADILAQAEHDVLAQALLVTPSRKLAGQVVQEIKQQAQTLTRQDYFGVSLPERGGAVIVPDLETAFDVANAYAAEHLQLSVRNPVEWLGKIKHAGTIFLGEHSFEVLGDYVAGPSHSLPTSGTARFASGINVWDFVKVTGIIGLKPDAAALLSRSASILAQAEGLTAHAAAADIRSQNDD